MTWKKDTEIQPCYHIKDITNASQNVKLLCVRFCHAFTGGDTTSSIHMFEKTSILSKTESSKESKRHCQSILFRRYACRSHWKCSLF